MDTCREFGPVLLQETVGPDVCIQCNCKHKALSACRQLETKWTITSIPLATTGLHALGAAPLLLYHSNPGFISVRDPTPYLCINKRSRNLQSSPLKLVYVIEKPHCHKISGSTLLRTSLVQQVNGLHATGTAGNLGLANPGCWETAHKAVQSECSRTRNKYALNFLEKFLFHCR